MSEYKPDFKQSMKYAFQLRKDKYYVSYIKQLVGCLKNMKPDDVKLKYTPTAFKDSYLLAHSQKIDPEQNTDYTLHNLTSSSGCIPSRKVTVKKKEKSIEVPVYTGFSLTFKNKTACKDFLKMMNIKPSEIFLAAWIDKTKTYSVSFRFTNTIFLAQYNRFVEALKNVVEFYKIRYGVSFSEYVLIPSSIYDRWFDPFSGKVLWDMKKIRHKTNHKIELQKLYNSINSISYRIKSNNTSQWSCINYYIENRNRIPRSSKLLRENLYVVNHFINSKNPYKSRDARRDWKYAAEQYLNEIIGKFTYKQDLYNEAFNSLEEEAYEKSNDVRIHLETIRSCKGYIESFQNKIETIKRVQKKNLEDWTEKDRIDVGLYSARMDERIKHFETLDSKIRYCENKIEINHEEIEFTNKFVKQEVDKYVKRHQIIMEENKDRLLSTFFSKKEIELFLRKLNLKTKIVPAKLRKVIIDFMLENNLITKTADSLMKVKCREFKLNIDACSEFYKKIFSLIEDIKVFYFSLLKHIYRLKRDGRNSRIDSLLLSNYTPRYFITASPPG